MSVSFIKAFVENRPIFFDFRTSDLSLNGKITDLALRALKLNQEAPDPAAALLIEKLKLEFEENPEESLKVSHLLKEKLSHIMMPKAQELVEEINEVQNDYKQRHPLLNAYSPEFLKNDFNYVLESVKRDGSTLKYAAAELKDQKRIAYAACENNPIAYRSISIRLKSDPRIALIACSKDGNNLRFVPRQLLDEPEILIAGLKNKPEIFKRLPDEIHENSELLMSLLDEIPQLFSYLNDNKKEDLEMHRQILDRLSINQEFKEDILAIRRNSTRAFVISKLMPNISKSFGPASEAIATVFGLPSVYTNKMFVPAFVILVMKTLGLKSEEITEFGKYFETHGKIFKNMKTRDELINFVKALDEFQSSPDIKVEIFNRCFATDAPIQEALSRARLLPLALKILDQETILALEDLSSRALEDLLTDKLILQNLLKPEHRELFIRKFITSREPTAIFTYIKNFIDDEDMKEVIWTFIENVITDQFISRRHAANSFNDELGELKILWEQRNTNRYSDKTIAIDSEDWQDLFLCGTEVYGSCQKVDFIPSLNKCLLGYSLDGKIRILALKKSEDGPIIARCILKIVQKDDGNLALLLEKVYPSYDHESFEKLKSLALSKADNMGLDLYMASVHEDDDSTPLSSRKLNPALWEYEDASHALGVTNGIYTVQGVKIN